MSVSRLVSVSEMQTIDREAIERIGIPRVVLMDHAGLAAAREIHRRVPESSAIGIVCGKGFNGGDGLACARHLHNWGHHPEIYLSSTPRSLKSGCGIFFRQVKNLGIPFTEIESEETAWVDRVSRSAMLADALLGIGLSGEVRSAEHAIIQGMMQSGVPILSLDCPSGLDADTGEPLGHAVKATVTVTFGLAKKGFFSASGKKFVGELITDSVTFPASLLRES